MVFLEFLFFFNFFLIFFDFEIYIYFFFDNSNRASTITKLYFYVLPLYHYIYELYVEITYSILYRNLNFKGKIFKLFVF